MPTPKKLTTGKYAIRATYRDASGKLIQEYRSDFNSARAAVLWAATVKDTLLNPYKGLTFSEMAAYFLKIKEQQGKSPSTLRNYKTNINYINNAIGKKSIEDISVIDLQQLIQTFIATPGTQSYVITTLSAIFSLAYKQDIIIKNPMPKVEKPSKHKADIKCYDINEYKKLLAIVKEESPRHYTSFLMLGALGLRPGEAISVLEDDIDPEKMCLKITKSTIKIGTVSTLKATKTESGIRYIPLNDAMIHELHWYKATYNIVSDYIFCNDNGEKMTSNSILKTMYRIREKHPEAKYPPYALRHTFGNMNKRNGVDSYTVSKLMGHASDRTTKDFYYSDDVVLNRNATDLIFNDVLKVENDK